MSTSDIMKLLLRIDEKLNDVIPKVFSIENRLNKLESMNGEVSDIKSSTSNILTEVRGFCHSIDSLPDMRKVSETSDSLSEISDQSDRGSSLSGSVREPSQPQVEKFGLVMADSDMSELADSTGRLLDCQVSMINYRGGQLEPDLFNNELEFVLIQDSGQVLDKYSQVTTDIIEEIKAHVQELVKLSVNILQIQPGTRVVLDSLPPRYNGRVSVELARVFNGLLVTESFMEDRITVTSQSQLTCRNEKKMLERYERDQVTLTNYGNQLRAKNIAVQIAQAVPQLKLVQKKQNNHHPSNKPRWPKSKQKLQHLLSEIMQKL